MKKLFEEELMLGMQKELVKQASGDTPALTKAAECLHAALEIFEEQGHSARADQLMSVMLKIAKGGTTTKVAAPKLHSLHQLMNAGVSERDLREFARGNPRAVGKLNLVLRGLGVPDHEISKFLGHGNLMTEEQAKKAINPNDPGSMLEFKSLSPEGEPKPEGEALEFKSLAQAKKDPAVPKNTQQAVHNMEQYGMPLKPTADHNKVDMPQPKGWEQEYQKWLEMTGKAEKPEKKKYKPEDIDPDLRGLIDLDDFDTEATDDELMGLEIKEDSLEVFDEDSDADFEDE